MKLIKTTRKYHQETKQGSAIAYSLAIIAAVTIITSSVIRFVVNKSDSAYILQSKDQSFQIAEAGINWYRWYLAHQTDGKTVAQIQSFWQGTSPAPLGVGTDYEQEYSDPSGGVIGAFRISVTPPTAYSTSVLVKSVGWMNKHSENKRTIQVRFRRPAWSEYSILIDESAKFGSGWETWGKIMSNTGVQFDGIAHNTIYSGLQTYHDSESNQDKPGVWSSWTNEINTDKSSNVFLGGKKFPVAIKDFNGLTVDLSNMRILSMQPNGATVDGCTSAACHFTFSGVGRHIILRTDGKFDIKTINTTYNSNGNGNNHGKIKTESSATTYNIPANGLIFVDGDTWVEGTINNSRVTIVAANIPTTAADANIYIGMGNISYTNFDAKDVIGLIAQGSIETIHDGLDNLTIDGALLAQNGMVGGNDRNPNCCSQTCAGLKGMANFFGAIASKQRISLLISRTKCNQNSNLYGYQNTGIKYDNNLLYYPPPYFPTGSQYSIDLWQEL